MSIIVSEPCGTIWEYLSQFGKPCPKPCLLPMIKVIKIKGGSAQFQVVSTVTKMQFAIYTKVLELIARDHAQMFE